ncbi:hypothetical protein KB553_13335 [Chryseobacterium rhizoplanae]|uniref:hypothetical protein n=1 Tax=Chryseobacterium rhizoplanae TaxID=1609531 RepID=UPI001CE2F829|nr:hypothetical protein [Chryseobacterium rhizoplanae]UCA58037.1 hypothetical protein KB553_13335 [Chryseobacterium rhizoplanae]
MKKNLAPRLMLLFALALSLQSCRTGEDYLSAKEEQYYSNKFQVFTSFNDEPIDYAKGFKTLMENYDGIHKTHYARTSAIKSGSLGKSDEEYVEFRLHSQSMLLEDNERWIIYPMVKNGQLSGLMAGILRNEETEVEFRKLDSGNDYYDEVLKIFSMAYLKHNLKNGLNNKGGGCGFDSDDACDIGNIDISPPKGGPKGTGPKSGCTGLNNCINPNLGGGGGEGGGPGGTGSSYVEPCDKTKTMLDSQKNKDIIKDLKDHLTKGAKAGEKGWRDNKTGAPTETTQNEDHRVNFGDPSTMNGGYHNHPGTGVNIFSATDLATLIEIARYQAIGNAGNAYMVVIAPGGIHYVMYFNGTHNEIPAYGSYSEGQLKNWNDEQWSTYIKTIGNDNLSNHEKLEKVVSSTLKSMGLQNKVILQRVEEDTKISTINQNSDGSTTANPCNT